MLIKIFSVCAMESSSPHSLQAHFTFGLLVILTEKLNLSSNSIGGGVPTELGVLSSLNELRLVGNNLEEGIPTEIGQLGSLSKSRIF